MPSMFQIPLFLDDAYFVLWFHLLCGNWEALFRSKRFGLEVNNLIFFSCVYMGMGWGMYLSKCCWKYEVVFCLWLWCYLLLVAAKDPVTHPTEVGALKAIKGSLIDPNGNLSSWNRGDPCNSNWTGVLCFNRTLTDGYLHVRELRLLNLNLNGTLAPEIGNLSYMEILNFMWNNVSGSIPKEIGNIKSLVLLLLNGNKLTGQLPEELGYLPKLDRIQIDQNEITGPVPTSFANLNMTKHFHMNNNSLTGPIPPELSRLPSLVHLLLDNNNLSGYLPPELSEMPKIRIIQLDNNDFSGNTVPDSYGNISTLLKLSLRNCNLQGPIPDFSRIPNLLYIDLSSNQLSGPIPSNKLSEKITTIDLSNNKLNGTIPSYFSGLPRLQKLSLANNFLNDSVPSVIWQNKTLNGTEALLLEFQHNNLTGISGSTDLPPNVTLWLEGNPLCNNGTLAQFCGSERVNDSNIVDSTNSSDNCPSQGCPPPYEYSKKSPVECFCAAPLLVGYRLKSPGFLEFGPYFNTFENYLSSGLSISNSQLEIDTFIWQEGPRLRMNLKLFPVSVDNQSSHTFNSSEVVRIGSLFTEWDIPDDDLFGPYELLNFTLLDPYRDVIVSSSSSGISTGALVGIVLGAIACAVTLSAIVTLLILRMRMRNYRVISKRHHSSRISIKIDGVRSFTYGEMALATNNFSDSSQVGQGGYGKVYKGILADGTVVAIKRAQEGSLQGEREFLTEIQLLSRLHHRNLVSLIGYCDEEGEQMLVYEFMPNGTLRDLLSGMSTFLASKFAVFIVSFFKLLSTGKSKEAASFDMRLRIALGSAKGILYLHTEADPPIFHRDVKSSNILLGSRNLAKVADFGLSRLAPVPDIEGIVPAHVSTVVKGTPGYLDPEYFLTRKLTDKSDVYSLGVVFLELLTGRHPISHGKNIVREVKVAYQSGTVHSVVDTSMGSYPSECVERFLKLALMCCQDETDARPTMAEVVRELENICSMMPQSNAKIPEDISIDSGKIFSSSSSSSAIHTPFPFISEEVSGSNLDSEVSPTIKPR
ncbi:putative LRR receptor-like serine/threonine-protein kinase [Senna tora]|uniref:non-specific serine/threonine protein kinase n=1 Tax=Senna tora TaxID=362788 RepID=A0A834T6M3_9FABA|nr:putative LRR receptor-like serine/threonine-protein kinase [Senna tora]